MLSLLIPAVNCWAAIIRPLRGLIEPLFVQGRPEVKRCAIRPAIFAAAVCTSHRRRLFSAFMKSAWQSLSSHTLRLIAVVALFGCGTVFAQRPHTLTGDIRAHKKFHSNILNNDRDILVYLPPGYDVLKSKRYSVLYLHDGQNLFDGATAFIPGQEWQVDETAQRLIAAGKIEPLIIVGINNAGKDRIDEYTPAADTKYKMGGKADLYGRMMVEELKPFIDSRYRTKRGAEHTGLGGSSLGGLVSMYLALKYPAVFGRSAVVSPSVWFANEQILHYVDALRKKPRVRIWMDMGTKEGQSADEALQTIKDARLLQEALVKKGWKLGRDLKYFEAEGAEHNERAWALRVEPILTFLFPRKL
jgi:predicted alpha/beta superfamily hydrolase